MRPGRNGGIPFLAINLRRIIAFTARKKRGAAVKDHSAIGESPVNDRDTFTQPNFWIVLAGSLGGAVAVAAFAAVYHPHRELDPKLFLSLYIPLEVIRIAASGYIGTVRLMTEKFGVDGRSLVIGMAFLCVAILCLFRVLANTANPSLGSPEATNLVLYYRTIAHWVIIICLFAASSLPAGKPVSAGASNFIAGLAVLITFAVGADVLHYAKALPPLFVVNKGVTDVAALLGYAAMGLSLLLAFRFAALSRKERDFSLFIIAVALASWVPAEFAYALVKVENDALTLVGDVLEALGFILILFAVVRQTLTEPYGQLARVRSALKSNEALNRALFELSPDAVLVHRDNRIVMLNPAAVKILGAPTADAVRGKSLFNFIRAEAHPSIEKSIRQALRGEAAPFPVEQLLRLDGEVLRAEAVAVPIAEQDAGAFLIILRDVTEKKRLEEQLHARAQELSRVKSELESFSDSLSHEVRAPLRPIAGFCNMLEEEYAGKLDETGREYIAMMLASVQRSDVLIDDLVRLVKIARQDLVKLVADISAIAREAIDDLKSAEPQREVDILIHEGIHAFADPGLVKVAIVNLLGNAWSSTRTADHPSIAFGQITKDNQIVYFVRDNGAGFSIATAADLFRPFRRLHPEDELKGSGIGLAIAERVIKKHGGRIWADSEPGQGATFYFTLG